MGLHDYHKKEVKSSLALVKRELANGSPSNNFLRMQWNRISHHKDEMHRIKNILQKLDDEKKPDNI